MPKSLFSFLKFEYWPVWLVYIPSLFYWAWLAIRARALFYMTATNPGIELGGFFGESKSAILDLVPTTYKLKTICIDPGDNYWRNRLHHSAISFPLVAKPNVGERGNGVEIIFNEPDLHLFLENKNQLYLLQEYSDYPFEYGVLFYRMPGETRGKVISITGKKFMTLRGDGKSTLLDLMKQDYRYSRQITRLKKTLNLTEILAKNEERLLEPIGNHCRGTEFTNENHLINEMVNLTFSRIAEQMDGFCFGRFDLKAKSPADLETGQHLHIMEVNGTTSEAGHIYSENYGVLNAYRTIFSNMKLVWEIGIANHKSGVAYTSPSLFTRTVWRHFTGKKPESKTEVIPTP